MPRIEDYLFTLEGAKVFGKIDCKTGYWQIPMNKQDIQKTAFITEEGLFEWVFMPMGLKGAFR